MAELKKSGLSRRMVQSARRSPSTPQEPSIVSIYRAKVGIEAMNGSRIVGTSYLVAIVGAIALGIHDGLSRGRQAPLNRFKRWRKRFKAKPKITKQPEEQPRPRMYADRKRAEFVECTDAVAEPKRRRRKKKHIQFSSPPNIIEVTEPEYLSAHGPSNGHFKDSGLRKPRWL